MKGRFRKSNLLVILGSTASGKTRVGVEIARVLDGGIISADSRQVFRGMDIGTGKDLSEYGKVPYHLVDIVDPGYEFSVFEFQRRFSEAFSAIQARGKLPILVGGTGLYLEAVLKRYGMVEVPRQESLREELETLPMESLVSRLQAANLRLHNTTDLLDRERVIRAIEIAEFREKDVVPCPLSCLNPVVFGIRWQREVLRGRITRRLMERLNQGMIEETKRLQESGVSFQTLDYYGLEYRFVARYLQGEFNRNDLFQKLNSAIHQFAKRQETWFHRMERRGILIHWIDGGREPTKAILEVLRG